jgi:integrase
MLGAKLMAKVCKRRDRYVLDYYDHEGNRQRQTMPKGMTLKAAEKKLRATQREILADSYIPEKDIPRFNEIAADWLKFKKPKIRKSTWEMYDGLLRNHFDTIINLKIKKITPQKVENFISDKQNAGMNISTLRRIITTFNQVMRYASRHRFISYNPFVDIERLRDNSDVGEDGKEELPILTHEKIRNLIEAVTNAKYKTLFQLAIFSGARQGELLGLYWSDIKWQKKQIHIQRTFNHGEWYKPKTKTSNRYIDIGPGMLKVLKKWKIACLPSKLNLIFPNENGNPIDAKNLTYRHFKPALKKAKIKSIRFHDIRHTFASLLIDQNENPKYIQRQLGHSSIQMTFDVYGHLIEKTNQESATKLEESVFKNNRSQNGHKNQKGFQVKA